MSWPHRLVACLITSTTLPPWSSDRRRSCADDISSSARVGVSIAAEAAALSFLSRDRVVARCGSSSFASRISRSVAAVLFFFWPWKMQRVLCAAPQQPARLGGRFLCCFISGHSRKPALAPPLALLLLFPFFLPEPLECSSHFLARYTVAPFPFVLSLKPLFVPPISRVARLKE